MGRGRAVDLVTPRLRLRRWRDTDRAPFAALNADPAVTEFLARPLRRDESNRLVDRIEADFDRLGYGWWAVEVPGVAPFVGFVGLASVRFAAPFAPAVEIGWRLARDSWGRGYATEGAAVVLDDAFGELGLTEVVSFTAVTNVRSRRVMERLGMAFDPAGDFDHPNLPEGHRLRHHVLYRMTAAAWAARPAEAAE